MDQTQCILQPKVPGVKLYGTNKAHHYTLEDHTNGIVSEPPTPQHSPPQSPRPRLSSSSTFSQSSSSIAQLEENYVLLSSGALNLSASHLIYSGSNGYEHFLLYTAISRVRRIDLGAQRTLLALDLKDFRTLLLYIPVLSHAENVCKTIEALSMPHNMKWLAAFKPFEDDSNLKGWELFSPIREYLRLGLVADEQGSAIVGDDGESVWRMSNINRGMKRCTTYPEHLIVPGAVEDDVLDAVIKHREGGRIPVVIYKDSSSDGVLLRSGQPRVGSKNKTCYPDSQLLRNVLGACRTRKGRGFILDTRTQSQALSEKGKGGGFEPTGKGQPYQSWHVHHCGIRQPAQLRSCFSKFLDACQDQTLDPNSFWSKVESSSWLEQVRVVLFCAVAGAKCIREDGTAVIVHGTTGFDNTCTVTSIIQLLLDPHFRTIKGFARLIEKEWLWMGHPFSSRHSHYKAPSSIVPAPVFQLFLDCVHQCLVQFPYCFEFTDDYLRAIRTHAHSCEFGTFLFNTPLERRAQYLSAHFPSAWPVLFDPVNICKYTNSLYKPDCEMASSWLRVSYRTQAIEVWHEMYCWPHLHTPHPEEAKRAELRELRASNAACKQELTDVLAEIEILQRAALKQSKSQATQPQKPKEPTPQTTSESTETASSSVAKEETQAHNNDDDNNDNNNNSSNRDEESPPSSEEVQADVQINGDANQTREENNDGSDADRSVEVEAIVEDAAVNNGNDPNDNTAQETQECNSSNDSSSSSDTGKKALSKSSLFDDDDDDDDEDDDED